MGINKYFLILHSEMTTILLKVNNLNLVLWGVSRVRDVAASIPLLKLGSVYDIYLANVGRQENIVFCWKKMEWESPPSILVTRNPNWSQRLGTGTGCVKGRY